jgi:hypothetical protein
MSDSRETGMWHILFLFAVLSRMYMASFDVVIRKRTWIFKQIFRKKPRQEDNETIERKAVVKRTELVPKL